MIKKILKVTYEERHMLIRSSAPINEIFEKYKFLKTQNGLIDEFLLCTNKPNLKYIAMKLLRLTKKYPDRSLEYLLKELPTFLNDTGKFLYNDTENEIPSYPVIITDNCFYWIRFEDSQYCRTSSLKDSMISWAISFFVFHIEIPEELSATLNYFL